MIWFIPWKAAAVVMRVCMFAHSVTFHVDKCVCWLAVKSCTPHYEMKNRYERAKEKRP